LLVIREHLDKAEYLNDLVQVMIRITLAMSGFMVQRGIRLIPLPAIHK
jgi:hypothetical protein